MITNSSPCHHTKGKNLVICIKHDVSSINDCQEVCTSNEPCLGYFYGTTEQLCQLIPSQRVCPSGYELRESNPNTGKHYKLAKTVNDVAQGNVFEGIQCYVKM